MTRLYTRMRRAFLMILSVMPVAAFLSHTRLPWFWVGPAWLAAQTVLAALIALLPAFVGNYREYEVVRHEGHGRGDDPGIDLDTVHELVKEGHRFPLRLAVSVIFAVLDLVGCMLLPVSRDAGYTLLDRSGFTLPMVVLFLAALQTIAPAHCIWEDVAGLLLGVIGYLFQALYLQFTKSDISVLQPVIAVCSVLFLFFGAVTLNKQSIVSSMSTHSGDKPIAPRQIVRRNRRIVLSFASVVTVVSVIEPIRGAVLWALARLGDLARWVGRLLGGGGSSGTEQDFAMPVAEVAGEAAAFTPEPYEESVFSDILVYGFFAVVALGLLVLIFDTLSKLFKKISDWMERFAGAVSEGFYDERQSLKDADEARDALDRRLLNRVRGLIKRETPWEKLTGRERARRLLRDFYKKRASKTQNLRAKTAREAIFGGDIASADPKAFSDLYDRARYSEHEVDAEQADRVKKDARL